MTNLINNINNGKTTLTKAFSYLNNGSFAIPEPERPELEILIGNNKT
jgi:hypothetical protein